MDIEELVSTWRQILCRPEILSRRDIIDEHGEHSEHGRRSEPKSWVLFHHGTCVLLPEPRPGEDLGEQALRLLAEHGPVHIGSPSAQFKVVHLNPAEATVIHLDPPEDTPKYAPTHAPKGTPGWYVTCHHPDILTYVEPTDVTPGAGDLEVGLCGRSKRHMDGTELTIAHVEDNRAQAARTPQKLRA